MPSKICLFSLATREYVLGDLNGQFGDTAMRDLILAKMPMPSAESMIEALCRAEHMYSSKGYTTVVDGSFEADMRPLLQFCTGAGLISLDADVAFHRTAHGHSPCPRTIRLFLLDFLPDIFGCV